MVVPAFGDEMNKCRRMLTELARALDQARIAVVIPDLFGTGDSEGSFSDANWADWVSDLHCVSDWALTQRLPVRGLVAVRTGSLLAAQFAGSLEQPGITDTIFWQPVFQGSTFVKQLLRVRTVAAAVNEGVRETVDELMARMRAGETIMAGGYPLTAAIAEPLVSSDLSKTVCVELGDLHSIEVTRVQERCGNYVEDIGARRISGVRYPGEPYWAAAETVCDMRVVARTAELLRERSRDLGD